ncbi:patatin-like phospholipase family protein [Iodobacter fluviatilis]|uniref:NTE family protein n=1 Tax=Iodobacter fluviatilis TaxID=537 RepID=A0A377SVF0_9NEIS|nr:patatin-like phospholipase family protein [Iodobacter fluviatilis]TCU81161.1 NTE family protein [Iodobacter fluviatilis]STR46001.1 NTE family protein rssA [Iodobacter fluviatilis]
MKKLFASLISLSFLAACTSNPPAEPKPLPKLKIGLALGGGAAKGFAHIGVIKMLEANGIVPDVVSGTSAGSVVGALYASGMNGFTLQERAFGLDESQIRDLSLMSGGLVKGQKLQDYVNKLVDNRPLDKLNKPFAAVATELDTGTRISFARGNTGQAVRASSSIPGVFEPVMIAGRRYVDGGVISPVPVDAAKELGADFIIAVDISSKANGSNTPNNMLGIVNQAVMIMGQKLGEQEMTRADFILRPKVGKIGAADFDQKNVAILEGEKATVAAISEIKRRMLEKQKTLAK